MKQPLPFISSALLLSLLKLSGCTSEREEQISAVDSHVGMECLAENTDLDSFRCIASKQSLIIPCVDVNPKCEYWASMGECNKNPQFMKIDCRKSCLSCISLHPDDEPQVAFDDTRVEVLWHLYKSQEYLHAKATSNIANLKNCGNNYAECTHWWAKGECETNPRFMKTECRLACRTC
ncbi:unnamed protein product [Pseudo-nitzschia multistriata]|uniref:ShKT domain-containing protein n=1 Tax=Pseudo-nitzschia multistriata TaxID=183589 RepID=A0A448Z4Q2_9STRA|nr:unnamed protein product [Pseudo-nitzschia multistriata]